MPHSLQHLLDTNDVSPRVIALLQQQLIDELIMAGGNYIPSPEHIIISDDRRKVCLDDMPEDTTCDYDRSATSAVQEYGEIMLKVLALHPNARLGNIAKDCVKGSYNNFNEVGLALERRISNTIYIPMLIIIALLIMLLAYLNNR